MEAHLCRRTAGDLNLSLGPSWIVLDWTVDKRGPDATRS